MLTAKAGERLSVEWSATNAPGGVRLLDATMHVFLDRESAAGAADSPKPGKDALYESAVVFDLEPGAKTSGEFHMAAPEAGGYLLRAEVVEIGQKPGRQISAAVRILVQ